MLLLGSFNMQQVPLSEAEKDDWFCSAAFQASLVHQQHLIQGPKVFQTHEVYAIYPLFFSFRACRVLEFSPGLDF